MVVIKVPKTPKSAFNPSRPASDLLMAQLEHLEAAAGNYTPRSSTKPKRRKRLTEGEVGRRTYELMRKLHPQVEESHVRVISGNPIDAPLADARPTSRGSRAKKTAKKSTGLTAGRRPRRKR